MDNKLKRAPGVYLTGFMGSGKTTVARVLADRLGWHFIDIDSEIETAEHATIAQIFESRGEPEFRRIETKMIRKVMRQVEHGMPSVIALGGGSFVEPANAALLENHGITVWLDCPFEVIAQRITAPDSRPLAHNPEDFRKLYEERRAAYSRANYRVDANCDPERAVELILALPCWK
ncbi:MAG: shikimate kinase [Bryobacteraceae bacterium]|jgi:shikimate kinase